METIAPSGEPKGAVLVIHSWWGLTASFREYGSVLSDAGYFIGLADLFDGKTAETEAEARALRARPRRTPMYKKLAADIAALCAVVETGDPKIGIVGFSMGGHWAVWLAQRAEYNVAATALYYAARAGDFSDCRSGIIAHFAEQDSFVTKNARRNMERAIHKSGCNYHAHDYPNTLHWFAESARPSEFDEGMARLALNRDLDHFQRNLRT
ncbi:MAG: dienelactone hydrolase family protein [Inquilinaceae bacterium]